MKLITAFTFVQFKNMSVTLLLILTNVVISLMAFRDRLLFSKLLFRPYFIRKDREYYRFLSSGFIHADYMHLAINMYVLYIFGGGVEEYFLQIKGESGRIIYLLFYLLAVVVSSVPSFEMRKHDVSYSSVGASGATSAIVFSSIIFAPWNKIYLMFIPIGIPAFIFGFIYLIYSYYMSKKGQDNIAHDVHFFGALFGVIFTLLLDHGILPYFIDSILNGR